MYCQPEENRAFVALVLGADLEPHLCPVALLLCNFLWGIGAALGVWGGTAGCAEAELGACPALRVSLQLWMGMELPQPGGR